MCVFFQGAPCLSFDVIPDSLGDKREEFPLTCYLVAGTQAKRTNANNIIVMKMSNLHKTVKEEQKEKDEEESDDESDDEDDDKTPELEAVTIKHTGSVNRIRVSH